MNVSTTPSIITFGFRLTSTPAGIMCFHHQHSAESAFTAVDVKKTTCTVSTLTLQ